MFPGQCGNTAFFFRSQPDQFHFEFRGIVFPGKSFFSAHEVSTYKISGCLSYRILDSGPDGTQTTLTVKHQTAFPFQISHKAGYAHFGRDLHKHMDMICTAFSFKNPYAFPLTQLSQNTACCSTLLSVEHLSSVFWRKNYVIFTVPSGVR